VVSRQAGEPGGLGDRQPDQAGPARAGLSGVGWYRRVFALAVAAPSSGTTAEGRHARRGSDGNRMQSGQTATNWLQYAHADYVRPGVVPFARLDPYRFPRSGAPQSLIAGSRHRRDRLRAVAAGWLTTLCDQRPSRGPRTTLPQPERRTRLAVRGRSRPVDHLHASHGRRCTPGAPMREHTRLAQRPTPW